MNRKLFTITIALILFLLTATSVMGALTDDIIAYYKQDSNTTSASASNDSSPYARHATLANIDIGQAGIIENATYSDSNADLMQHADIATSTALTINFWVYRVGNGGGNEDVISAQAWDGTGRVRLMMKDTTTNDFAVQIYNSGGDVNTGYTIPNNAWHMVTVEIDDVNNNVSIWFNGTLHTTGVTSMSSIRIPMSLHKWGHDANQWTNTRLDEIGYWNRSLTQAEITQLYAGGSGLSWPFSGAPTATTDIDFTAVDDWSGASITNFTVNVSWSNGTTTQHSTTNGTVSLINVSSGNINVTYWNATDYFNLTLYDQTITANTSNSVQAELFQAYICFNATQKVNEAWVTLDNVTIDSTVRTTPFCYNLSADTYNVLAQKNGYYPQNQTFTVTALQNATLTVQNLSYTNLTIYAIDGTTNESLSGYDITINSISNPTFTETATGATNQSFYLINDTYNVTIYKAGYAITTATANVTVAGHTNYTFTLYRSNSVTITILDEITNDLITSNITVRWTNNATTWENVTSTGHLFVSNLTPSNYTLLFYGSNYSTRTYTITVGNLSTQFLTAYMISSEYSTIFTIKDKDTGDTLPDVSFTMYKLVNSTWTTVESKYSDITGKIQVYYDPIGNYRFYLNLASYEDLVFYLNPILFDTYDVFMEKGNPLNYSVDYDDISIIYAPHVFNNNENTSFNFLISSPDGLLTDYGLTLTYPGGSQSASGVNAIGEQLSVWANITNATRWDRVRLDFNYTTSIAGTRTFTQYLDIVTNATASENTWMANKDRTFGMGLFERFLIVTIIVIFTVGIASLVGQVVPGMAIGLFLFGFMVYIGFIPIWGIIPSMIIGVIFLVWKSGGY